MSDFMIKAKRAAREREESVRSVRDAMRYYDAHEFGTPVCEYGDLAKTNDIRHNRNQWLAIQMARLEDGDLFDE